MGPAHASVVNQTSGKLCVITFNKADLLFHFYTKLYIVEPNETVVAEATPDPVGLYVAIVYKASDGLLHYKRWMCQNESELVVNAVVKADIDVTVSAAIEFRGAGKVRERNSDTLREISAALVSTSSTALKQSKTLSSSNPTSSHEDSVIPSGKPKSKRNTLDKVSESISKIERKQEESMGKKAEKALLESLQKAKLKASSQDSREAGKGKASSAASEWMPPSRSVPKVESDLSALTGDDGAEEIGNGRSTGKTDKHSIPAAEEAPKGKALMRKATSLLKRAALALGPAHGFVENRTSHMVCVITFNKSDLLLTQYSNLYILDPDERVKVEAIPDPVGLFIALVFKAADHTLHYKRWLCRNEGELIVHSVVNMYEIRVSGSGIDLKGVGRIRENDAVPYKLALDALADVATTTASMQEAIRPVDEPHSYLPSLSKATRAPVAPMEVSDEDDGGSEQTSQEARRRQAAKEAEEAFSASMFKGSTTASVESSSSSREGLRDRSVRGKGVAVKTPPPPPPPPQAFDSDDDDDDDDEEEEEEEEVVTTKKVEASAKGREKEVSNGKEPLGRGAKEADSEDDDDDDDDDDEDDDEEDDEDDEDEDEDDSDDLEPKRKAVPVVDQSTCGAKLGKCVVM